MSRPRWWPSGALQGTLARRLDRRLVAVGLAGAVVALEFAWATTTSVNCPPGNPPPYCQTFGLRRPVAFTLLAVPAGLLAAGLGALVPPRWLRPRRALGRLVFAPSDATLAALAVVFGYGVLVGPPLFYGLVTARPSVWLVLAVPFAPFVLALGGAMVAAAVAPADAGPLVGGLGAVGLVALVLAAVLAQVVWFYLLAAGLARLAGTVRWTLFAVGGGGA